MSWGKLEGGGRGSPEVASDGVGHFEEEDAGRVDEPETADDGHVLGEYVFRVCARVQKAFAVAVR